MTFKPLFPVVNVTIFDSFLRRTTRTSRHWQKFLNINDHFISLLLQDYRILLPHLPLPSPRTAVMRLCCVSFGGFVSCLVLRFGLVLVVPVSLFHFGGWLVTRWLVAALLGWFVARRCHSLALFCGHSFPVVPLRLPLRVLPRRLLGLRFAFVPRGAPRSGTVGWFLFRVLSSCFFVSGLSCPVFL